MCQHFCIGGIVLIIVFSVVFVLAIFLNVTGRINKVRSLESEFNSSSANHMLNSSDFKIYSGAICDPLYTLKDNKFNSERENFVPNLHENFPLLVHLNYRTTDKNIENLCNGVAIHNNYILTLAQCLVDNSERELISVTTNGINNAREDTIKISNIIFYDTLMNRSTNMVDDIGLIKIENGEELTNMFCTRPVKNTAEILENVWNGSNLKLTSCSIRKLPKSICVNDLGSAQLGDPLIEYRDGVWYLIGLHQGNKSLPIEMSMYADVYLYRFWISTIIQSDI